MNSFRNQIYYDIERIDAMFHRMEVKRITNEWTYKDIKIRDEFTFLVIEEKIWLRNKLSAAVNPSLVVVCDE